MMTTAVETRGNVVTWSTNFLDKDGNVVISASANLRIVFVGGDYRQTVNVSMSLAGTDGPWTASWDTSVAGARPGLVYWSAQATDPPGAEDGNFQLDANTANQAIGVIIGWILATGFWNDIGTWIDTATWSG